MIPSVVAVYGKATYLAAIVTVFGHPGRRFGMMAEALVLAVLGLLVGVAWSIFGVYLSGLVYPYNEPAAYTVKGVFLLVAMVFHGFLRSHTPRLFLFVLLIVIVCVVGLTGTAKAYTPLLATQLLYPILTAVAVLLLVNTCIFPEFSSDFLGTTTIETLGETVGALRDAGSYFVADVGTFENKEGQNGEHADSEEGNAITTEKSATAAEPPSSSSESPSVLRRLFSSFSHGSNAPAEPEGTKQQKAPKKKVVKLNVLTGEKAKLRAKLAACKAMQQECNFELAFAVLPPRDLKPISDTAMKAIVANTLALIGACESKWFLTGDMEDSQQQPKPKVPEPTTAASADVSGTDSDILDSPYHSSTEDSGGEATGKKRRKSRKARKKAYHKAKLELEKEQLDLVKPKREIEYGDLELFQSLLRRISEPLHELQETIDRSVDVVTSCLAYCYDVPTLPSGSKAPSGIVLEELDIRTDILQQAITDFDTNASLALEGAANLDELESTDVDITPRMETFLISSFILNLRQAAMTILQMLKESRKLVEKRQARHERRRIWAPRIRWAKWLVSGGEQDMLALPESGRQQRRKGAVNDIEEGPDLNSDSNLPTQSKYDETSVKSGPNKSRATSARPRKVRQQPLIDRLRHRVADGLDYIAQSDDCLYAFKITVAVFVVSWPAFISSWNTWYSLNRGLWASLQLVLVTENAIGTSIQTFTFRLVGTIIGCIWGYAAYQSRDGNRITCVVLLVIGILPASYLQLGTRYIKIGMVLIISMSVVSLATIDKTVPGSATENFLKRLIAFIIGGVVALVVEVVLFPVKARVRLVESLASSIRQISEMEACVAHGIETETNVNVYAPEVTKRFNHAKAKAEASLTAAQTFLPFCSKEPRLKGSFAPLALVYTEIIFVLHQIIDRMDNMLQLRKQYGSGVLEELNTQVYPYRRNVAASITLILFAVHEALTTKLPLPQFLPSARLAHLRMVNRVRELVIGNNNDGSGSPTDAPTRSGMTSELEATLVKRLVKQKYLSWSAASAGQVEVIEYLEELVELVKLLVGAQEFRSGLLERPTYRQWVERIGRETNEMSANQEDGPDKVSTENSELEESKDIVPSEPPPKMGLTKRLTGFGRSDSKSKPEVPEKKEAEDEELPRSLQRVRTRRFEESKNRLEKVQSKQKKSV
jgi:hypothetical protein